MISTSGMVLTALLARRFGERWVRRWRALADEETRWLALHLIDTADRGGDLATNEAAILALMAGRSRRPLVECSERSAASFLSALRAAQVWPLPEARRLVAPSILLHQTPADGLALEH